MTQVPLPGSSKGRYPKHFFLEEYAFRLQIRRSNITNLHFCSRLPKERLNFSHVTNLVLTFPKINEWDSLVSPILLILPKPSNYSNQVRNEWEKHFHSYNYIVVRVRAAQKRNGMK